MGCTLDVQAPRKASTKALNLSNGEMSFNFSLSISIQISTTIGSPLPSVLDVKQSSALGQTPVRCVWAEEAVWNHSSMEVTGGRIQRHHVSSNSRRALVYFRLHRPTQGASSGSTMCSLCLALYAIMFIKLCFSFRSVFAYFYPHVVSYFFLVSPLV
jgi:hypothetical protein